MTYLYSTRKQIVIVTSVTLLLLLVPLVAMQFSHEVNWQIGDFMVMGTLLIATGFSYCIIVNQMSKRALIRIAVGLAVLCCFALVWVNLAVGLIASESHPANLLCYGVVIIAVIGTIVAGNDIKKLSTLLFLMAVMQWLIPVIAIYLWALPVDHGSDLLRIFLFNSVFAIVFLISGFLFRYQTLQRNHTAG